MYDPALSNMGIAAHFWSVTHFRTVGSKRKNDTQQRKKWEMWMSEKLSNCGNFNCEKTTKMKLLLRMITNIILAWISNRPNCVQLSIRHQTKWLLFTDKIKINQLIEEIWFVFCCVFIYSFNVSVFSFSTPSVSIQLLFIFVFDVRMCGMINIDWKCQIILLSHLKHCYYYSFDFRSLSASPSFEWNKMRDCQLPTSWFLSTLWLFNE